MNVEMLKGNEAPLLIYTYLISLSKWRRNESLTETKPRRSVTNRLNVNVSMFDFIHETFDFVYFDS